MDELKCCCNACAWNICYLFVVQRVHLELCNKCVSPSLPAACCLASPILMEPHPNGAPLYCSNLWHTFYLATQHHVDCVHPSGKLAAELGSRPSLFPSCVVCSHHACCLPDNIPECMSSSPVLTAECWKTHVMCQVTLQLRLSLFELSTSRRSRVRKCCKITVYNSGIKLHKKVAGRKSLLVGLHAATETDGAW
jgi:hypothetical protein